MTIGFWPTLSQRRKRGLVLGKGRKYRADFHRYARIISRRALSRLRGCGAKWQADKEYWIGRNQILLPPDHALPRYQNRWRRYDQALGDIVRVVRGKYRDANVIDVGANVGDTAALLCTHENIPVLAIEGNSRFLPYLRENARRLGKHVQVLECFVGPSDLAIDLAAVTTSRGTSSIVSAIDCNAGIGGAKSLSSIVEANPRFGRARLLKIDTDGFDFEIIHSSLAYLADTHPVLFFEYDTGIRPDDETRSLLTIEGLMGIGYDRFMVYDNFGNFLMSVDRSATFAELNAYLRSNRRYGIAVYYFDVCCFHNSDRDLFEAVRSDAMST